MRELSAAGPSAIHGWMPEQDDLYFEARWPEREGEDCARVFCRSAITANQGFDQDYGHEEESFLPYWRGVADLMSYGRVQVTIGSPLDQWEPNIEAAKTAVEA
jgi:hypothetical protein